MSGAAGLLKLGAGLYGAYRQYQAGEAAKDAADENARRVEQETAEQRRRERRRQRKAQSTLRSRAAASGIKLSSGSTQTFLNDYVEEDERQLSWLTRSGSSQASILRKQGEDDKRNMQYGAYASFFNSVGNWWQER